MRKFKRSNWLTATLFIYVTAMAIYFLPRNTQTGNTEKYVTVAASYVIVALLWFVLRRKERFAAEREKDIQENGKKENKN